MRDEDVDFEKCWELGWWRREFRTLRKDPAFCAVVTLARAVNVLRFCQCVMVEQPKDGTPSARRQTMNCFFLLSALLVESERLVNGMGKHFGRSDEYIGLARVVHCADFQTVVERFRDLRNQHVAHFDDEAARAVLPRRDGDFERFLSSRGTLNKDYYYDLGDIVAFEVVAGTFETREAFDAWAGPFLTRAAEMTTAFLDAADDFIGSQVVGRWNAVKRQVPDPPAASDSSGVGQ